MGRGLGPDPAKTWTDPVIPPPPPGDVEIGAWLHNFDINGWMLKPEHQSYLTSRVLPCLEAVAAEKGTADVDLSVQGHCSKTGSFTHNLELSFRRVFSVANALASFIDHPSTGVTVNSQFEGYSWLCAATHPNLYNKNNPEDEGFRAVIISWGGHKIGFPDPKPRPKQTKLFRVRAIGGGEGHLKHKHEHYGAAEVRVLEFWDTETNEGATYVYAGGGPAVVLDPLDFLTPARVSGAGPWNDVSPEMPLTQRVDDLNGGASFAYIGGDTGFFFGGHLDDAPGNFYTHDYGVFDFEEGDEYPPRLPIRLAWTGGPLLRGYGPYDIHSSPWGPP
jgi:hypothetical protein